MSDTSRLTSCSSFPRGSRRLVAVVLAMLLLGFSALPLTATPAGLDPSFGTDGVVTTSIFWERDEAQAVALQPDGKILVAGSAAIPGGGMGNEYLAVVRYTADGHLDTSFAGDGIATT